ncbi:MULTISPECIES: hypothetical protein [Enterobacteriaceae]|uniref:hypothetical protein n=1 Tax=Enterobacteriaceae TaxID=543 RepID=UPI000AC64743|nr:MULTISPECIES: hypothetical protein [Enterobacteriaceae]
MLPTPDWMINHYRDNTLIYNKQHVKAKGNLQLANDTINIQRDATMPDEKYIR